MSGVATAIVGGAVIGGVMSKNAADNATEASSQAAANELAFNQQQYDDWKEVYGPIQDNLSEYYTNLSPDMYEAQGLEAFNAEYQKSMDNLNQSLAQRGIVDSGLSAQLTASSEINAAQQRATIRMTAPTQVAEAKSNFLQIGLGQDPTGDVANTLSGITTSAQANANAANAAAGQAIGNAVSTAGTALVDYLNT